MPVKHIALFSFKSGTRATVVQRTCADLCRLAQVIPGITDFSLGENNSPEGLADGLTHGFVMTFRNGEARDTYLPHPEHEKFKTAALPHIAKVVVFDYHC